MTALVATIVRFSHRHRIVVLGAVAISVLVSMAGIRRLSLDSDVLSLLPQEGRVIGAFRTFAAHFGGLDQLYVVFTAPNGQAISEYGDEVAAWVAALREAPEIERVDAGVLDGTRDVLWLADRELLLLDGPLLDEALRRFSPDGMPGAILATRELLSVPSAEVAAIVQQDPLGLFGLVRDALGRTQAGLNIGMSPDGYVTADGRARLVIVRPKRPPYDTTFSRALDARLTDIAASVGRQPRQRDDSAGVEALPAMQVDFAGGHRIAVETEAVVKRESIFNSVGSLALILPLLFFVFRSARLVAIGALPSAVSLVLVLGGIGFVGARLSAAATGATAMLFGLGVDGVVLLYVAHQLALARGGAADATSSLEGPSISMLLGMFTTAATFYGLVFVDFPSLRQLGLLIGHSMVACGVLTLIMVPALLPRHRARQPRPSLVMPGLAKWVARRQALILVGAALLTLGLGLAAIRVKIDPTLDRLRSTTDAARLLERLGPAFGLPNDVFVVLAEGPDLQPLLQTNERLAARLSADLPGLSFEPPTRLLPSEAVQTARRHRLEAAALSVSRVEASVERSRVVAGFAPQAFAPFIARLPALIDPSQRLSYEDYTAGHLDDLIGRFISKSGETWRLVTYVFPQDAVQAARVQAVVEAEDPSQTLTGLPMVNADLAKRFLPDFLRGLGVGTVLVALLVILTFRSVRLTLFALLPTAVGLIWTAGLLAMARVTLDLFAIFSVVTFVGIGVDYGVHLVHRFQERGDPAQATAELAPVILVAAAITLFGYATLITSSYPPLRSIGVVSTVSVLALAAASILLLPALLMRSTGRS